MGYQGLRWLRLLLWLAPMAALIVEGQNVTERDFFRNGNDACPCLTNDTITDVAAEDLTDTLLGLLGSVNPYSYGIGCGTHDAETASCTDGSCAFDPNIAPQKESCDRAYCERSFCYVNPNTCSLLFRRSQFFPNSQRFYSYATCWDVDSFVSNSRIRSLENRTFKVGLNSNSGGWVGAFRHPPQQFEGPLSLWFGPVVDFAIAAASRGNFRIKLTTPPSFLANRSLIYFGSSSFDFCVYATSLGYLDFCLAQYTITDQRAITADWLILNSQELNLVVQLQTQLSNWDDFKESLSLVFAPFQVQTWLFVVFFVIPFLGALMVIHEYNHPGSSYPAKHNVIVKENKRRSIERVEERRVPYYQHITRAIYINLLSVLQQNYVHTVVSYGAMMNLLGISFFILTIIAVYTANLAAILTQQAQKSSISNLADVMSAKLRICSERKNLETIRALYPEIDDSNLVVDPIELGGDGLPGFNCANCSSRVRVFNFLDIHEANAGNPLFCHVAFAPEEDLVVEQNNGFHCNKTIVGARIGQVQTGIPIFEGVSQELIAYFLKLKNDGLYDGLIKDAEPMKSCPKSASQEEGSALSIAQLTGIWVVSFGFAFIGLLIRYLQPKIEKRRKETVKAVHQFDQTGQRINVLDRDDQWMDSQSIFKGNERVFVGDSRWAKATTAFGGGSATNSTASMHGQTRHLFGAGVVKRSFETSISDVCGDRFNMLNRRGNEMGSVKELDESSENSDNIALDDSGNVTYPKFEEDENRSPSNITGRPLPPISLTSSEVEDEKDIDRTEVLRVALVEEAGPIKVVVPP